jgi:hypothetical protein
MNRNHRRVRDISIRWVRFPYPAVVMVASLLSTNSLMAVTPAEKCEADKLKTSGKYSLCRMKAEAKACTSSK